MHESTGGCARVKYHIRFHKINDCGHITDRVGSCCPCWCYLFLDEVILTPWNDE